MFFIQLSVIQSFSFYNRPVGMCFDCEGLLLKTVYGDSISLLPRSTFNVAEKKIPGNSIVTFSIP